MMRRLGMTLMGVALAGCSMAPEYTTPEVAAPSAYKEQPAAGTSAPDAGSEQWKPAEPRDGEPRGAWWTRFGDPVLNEYEERAASANQDLAAALARLEGSRALVRVARSAQMPRVEIGAAAAGVRPSSFLPGIPPPGIETYNRFQFGANVRYELDLFGRVRDSVRAARSDNEANEALYQSLLLAIEADVAQTYFLLRALDAELAVLADIVTTREGELAIYQQQLAAGSISATEVERASGELANARAEVQTVVRQRAQYEHGLALLLGLAPADLTVTPAPLASHLPEIPLGLPSALLERRPDIAAAERRMRAANSRIGVARAAFYPVINLSAEAGFTADSISNLLKFASHTWALGPLAGALIAAPLFDGGRNKANLAGAEAEFDAEVANYRQSVLNSFRDVEDQLVALRTLHEQSRAVASANQAAARRLELANSRFQSGASSYLGVLEARRELIASRRVQKQLDGARAASTVGLVRALGGDW